MRTQYNQFKITSTFIGDKLWNADDKNRNYNNHLVTVVNTETHKKTAFEFWGSIVKPEIETEQELLFAFYCFLSDGQGSRCGFEEFCSEFGYDTDSRKAYKTFKACEKSLHKAERIGINEEMACDIMNDLQENYGWHFVGQKQTQNRVGKEVQPYMQHVRNRYPKKAVQKPAG